MLASTLTELDWVDLADLSVSTDEAAQTAFLRAWQSENDRLRRVLGVGPPILATRLYYQTRQLRAEGISGTLRVAEREIRVVPKFMQTAPDRWEQALLSMVSFSNDLHFDVGQPVSAAVGDVSGFVDHVASTFCDSLDQGLRSGPLLLYREQEVTSEYARGRILFEPLEDLIINPHRVRCIVDEMDLDNSYTGLLLWAIQTLLGGIRKPALRSRLETLKAYFSGVQPRRASSIQPGRSLPAQYSAYQRSIEIAAWLARSEAVGQVAGDNLGSSLVLFMPLIFQQFVSVGLRAVAGRVRNPVTGGRVASQASDRLAGEIGGNSFFETRPDDRLILENRVALLVDSKYKETEDGGLKPSREDLYQMSASCLASGCNRVLLVYPSALLSRPVRSWAIRNSLGGSPITVSSVGLNLQALADPGGISSVLDQFEAAVLSALSVEPTGV